MAYRLPSTVRTSGSRGRCGSPAAAAAAIPAVTRSSSAIRRALRQRSASAPPVSIPARAGSMARAVMPPYSAAESVCRSRYSGSANRRAALPNRETICPRTIRTKVFMETSCFFIYKLLVCIYIQKKAERSAREIQSLTGVHSCTSCSACASVKRSSPSAWVIC